MNERGYCLQQINTPARLDKRYLPADYEEQEGAWLSPIDGVTMLLVPGGPFIMGSQSREAYQDEKPAHEVYLPPYLIDSSKVTRESYSKFIQAIEANGGHHPEWCHPEEPAASSHFPDNWSKQELNLALQVTGIDWYDAWAYARWAGKMLPTEAQWEKACLVFSNTRWSENTRQTMLSPMLGKGWEWCQDWYQADYYCHSPRYAPCNLEKSEYKICRGGIYNTTLPLQRSSFRNRYPPEHRDSYLGLRCVQIISQICL